MIMTLSKNVEKGNRVRTSYGWRKVTDVTDEGAVTKEIIVPFGSTIFGWKNQ